MKQLWTTSRWRIFADVSRWYRKCVFSRLIFWPRSWRALTVLTSRIAGKTQYQTCCSCFLFQGWWWTIPCAIHAEIHEEIFSVSPGAAGFHHGRVWSDSKEEMYLIETSCFPSRLSSSGRPGRAVSTVPSVFILRQQQLRSLRRSRERGVWARKVSLTTLLMRCGEFWGGNYMQPRN